MRKTTLREMMERLGPPTKEEQELNKKLRESVKQKLTPEEIKAQRLSWVMAMMPRELKMTREEAKEILDEIYG